MKSYEEVLNETKKQFDELTQDEFYTLLKSLGLESLKKTKLDKGIVIITEEV